MRREVESGESEGEEEKEDPQARKNTSLTEPSRSQMSSSENAIRQTNDD